MGEHPFRLLKRGSKNRSQHLHCIRVAPGKMVFQRLGKNVLAGTEGGIALKTAHCLRNKALLIKAPLPHCLAKA